MLSAQTLTQILNAALQKLWVNECDLFTDGMEDERSVHERNIVAIYFITCRLKIVPSGKSGMLNTIDKMEQSQK